VTILSTFIMSATALRFAQEVPDQSLDLEIESIKHKLMTEPEKCDEHAVNLLGNFESFLSTAQKSQIQKAFSNVEHHTDLQFLTIGTKHTACMTDNWFVHALNATIEPAEFVHISLDAESQLSCERDLQPRGGKKHIVKCVDLSDFLPWSEAKQAKMSFGSCIFQLISYTKVQSLKVAASSLVDPSTLLMMDTDIIVHRDVRELLSSGRTYMFQMQDEAYHMPNTGFININRNVTGLLDGWMQFATRVYPSRKADQDAMKSFLSSDAGLPFKQEMRLFSKKDVMKCGHPGKYATHYNCYSGSKKQTAMLANGVYQPASPQCTGAKLEKFELDETSSVLDQELAELLLSQ